jgi:hypothetical protein
MKKAALLAALLIAFSAGWVYAESVVYRVTAHIPSIVGVNVPPFDDPQRQLQYELAHGLTHEPSALNSRWEDLDTITEELVRNDQRIVLMTVVGK